MTCPTRAPHSRLIALAPRGSALAGRAPSTMCAVNRGARFRPHVDAGSAGAGQGSSLIVALGDYSGGQLVVEKTPHAIRYAPLQFDGRQRAARARAGGEREKKGGKEKKLS